MLDLAKHFTPEVFVQFKDTIADYDDAEEEGKVLSDVDLAAALTRDFQPELGMNSITPEMLQYWRAKVREEIQEEMQKETEEERLFLSTDAARYYGVKGWLRFFVTILMIVQPVAAVILVTYMWGSVFEHLRWMSFEETSYFVTTAFVEVILSFVGIWVAVKLNRIEPDAVRYTKIWLLASGVWALVSFILSVGADITDVRGFVQALAWVAIWYSYFSKSERVRCTYHLELGIAVSDLAGGPGGAVSSVAAGRVSAVAGDFPDPGTGVEPLEEDEEYVCPHCETPIVLNETKCKQCGEALEW
jgi:hypothetical protein